MKCPKCKSNLRKVEVEIEGAESKVVSFQCQKCNFVDFESESSKKILKELKQKEAALKIKQKIIKLSKDRLGMYFNKNIVESLDLKAGEEIKVAIPDKKHIILIL